MGYTVRELQERMDAHEFAEWMAMYRIDPFGEARDDYRAGMIAATIANVNRDEKMKPEPFTPQDFMPQHDDASHDKTAEPQSAEEQLRMAEFLNELLGGLDLRQH